MPSNHELTIEHLKNFHETIDSSNKQKRKIGQ